jgi:hypothetical protein
VASAASATSGDEVLSTAVTGLYSFIDDEYDYRVRWRLTGSIIVIVLLLSTATALASKTETGASGPVEGMNGWDWVGRVSLGFSPADYGPGSNVAAQLIPFSFANECDKRGSLLNAAITIGRDKRFRYHGHGFMIWGNVIGSLTNPREVAGFASVRTHGCASGPWWFDAYPTPPS